MLSCRADSSNLAENSLWSRGKIEHGAQSAFGVIGLRLLDIENVVTSCNPIEHYDVSKGKRWAQTYG